MRKIACVCFVALLIGSFVSAQKETKPWTEWTQKDVQRVLNASAWAQTQVETEKATGSTAAVTSTAETMDKDPSKPASGSVTGYMKYFIRFLSARPIRQAVVRKLQLERTSTDPGINEQLKTFAESSSNDFIVVSVAAEASNQKIGGTAIQAFNTANLESLKPVTYLERKDGQRLELSDLRPPANDGLGAKFVFPRMLNKQPFINDSTGEVRFYCQLSKTIKLSARFKVSEMVYDGKLEY